VNSPPVTKYFDVSPTRNVM